ncbi:putative serine dehydratase domain-containing protein [Kalaharituber pfeilii]|nr:putative serine dehydratase domain-containing protein [Kalaharituber pfeilii]
MPSALSVAAVNNSLYPSPSKEHLKSLFVGQPLSAIPTPAAVLDLAIVRKNCRRMLWTCNALGIGFRGHVKTHKLSHTLGHLEELSKEGGSESWNYGVFIKLDAGYNRAGIHATEGHLLRQLIEAVGDLCDSGIAKFRGLYTHSGNSYSSSRPEDALWLLSEEIQCALDALQFDVHGGQMGTDITISVGASPTALVLENLLNPTEILKQSTWFFHLQQLLEKAKSLKRVNLEVHAGVYTILDLQQIATNVLAGIEKLELGDIALTVLAEVASVYPVRSEALVNVGTLGLGREPGKVGSEWEGIWGLVSNWAEPTEELSSGAPLGNGRWVVKKISQEHGILSRKNNDLAKDLIIGDKLRIFPQHACIAGSGHGWYIVVDSDKEDRGNIVQDVWVRFRGW